MLPSFQPRRTHRKQISALRLSSDTTTTLPEYIPSGWQRSEEENPSDRPPDYPDSAEEADEDTDTDNHPPVLYVPPLISPQLSHSPRRFKRTPSHRRRQPTPNDPYLDSLLARSVHALEMSNTLLQSSISTQSSLSTIFAADSPVDHTLEARARGLSSRIRGNGLHENWAEDLDEIRRGVEGLFDPGSGSTAYHPAAEANVSSSLPTSSPISQRRYRRRPSLDLRLTSASDTRRLQFSMQDRSRLVAPPPRPLTQFVASTSDPDVVTLPSTLGLRAPPTSHPTASTSDRRPLSEAASNSNSNLHATLSPPTLNDRPIEPLTPAYNMLSSFVQKPPSDSSTPSSSFTSPRTSFLSRPQRASPSTSTERDRDSLRARVSPSRVARKSPEGTRSSGDPALHNTASTSRSSRPQTPKPLPSPLIMHRSMTPPTEESSSSSDGCPAKLTVVSLRKILDDQPAPKATADDAAQRKLRAPAFLPRTPAPVAEAGTSTATASISRLFTKAKHSSSTRAPSPPRHSAMKSSSSTPSPSPTVLHVPDFFLGRGSSAPSSGPSTPKRISFAELPESYAGTRPEGSRFRKGRRKGKKDDKGKGKEGEEIHSGGWWAGWLVGGGGGGLSGGGYGVGAGASLRHEERMEDRMSRTWAGRMGAGFGPGVDEWAV